MAWSTEIIPLVRGLINDIDLVSPTYSDAIITQYIVYAAHFMLTEISFPTTYSVDVSHQTISPDPTTPTIDLVFINMVSLKSAILILTGEVKTATAQAVRINDGPSSVDMTAVYKAKMELLRQYQQSFDKAKIAVAMGDASVGQAILTPYTQEYNFSSSYYYR